ncbi:MAG: MarR family transcriptional regulator [Ilumatobacteraceae bacterium]
MTATENLSTANLSTAAEAGSEIGDDAGAALASALRVGIMRLARRLRLERDSDALTPNQFAVLGNLKRIGPMTVGELATAERVKPPSMTRTVADLEHAGLVVRRPHHRDRRQVVVELTAAAQLVIDAERRRRDAWLAQRLDALDPAELALLEQVAPLLERIAAS